MCHLAGIQAGGAGKSGLAGLMIVRPVTRTLWGWAQGSGLGGQPLGGHVPSLLRKFLRGARPGLGRVEGGDRGQGWVRKATCRTED